MTVLLDNTVLSNFSSVRRPDLVRDALGDPVGTTEQAYQELVDGVASGKVPACDWRWLEIIALADSERAQYEALCEHLGSGEASCLAAAQRRAYRVATDDRDARRVARQLGIPITGTLGILAILAKRGSVPLTEADGLLQQMVAAGFRAPLTSLRTLLG